MAGSRKLSIEIVGDAKGVGRAFSEAEESAGRFSGTMGKVGKAAGVAFGVVAGGALLAGKAALDWGQAAADDEAEQALFEQSVKIAGASNDIVDAFNNQIDAGMKLKGFTDTELREAYAQAYGQSKDLAQSQEDVALAMDVARKAGVPLNTALDAITKAHNGQTTALSRMLPEYGALIKDAGSSAAALDLVRNATQGAADTFANTSQGQMQRAKMAFGEITESIGAALLPVLAEIAPIMQDIAAWMAEHLPGAIATAKKWINDDLMPVLRGIGEFFGELVGWVQDNWDEISKVVETAIGYVKGVIETVTGAITVIWENWGGDILAFIAATWETIRGVVDGVINVIRGIIQTVTSLIKGDWEGVWNGIKTFIDGIWTGIRAIVEGAIEAVKAVLSAAWTAVKLTAQAAWDRVVEIVSGAIDRVVGFVLGIGDRIGRWVGSAFDGLKDAMTGAKDWVSDRIDDVIGFFTGIGDKISGAMGGVKDLITAPFRSAFNGIASLWNNTVGKLSFTIPDWVPVIGGKGFSVPDIPTMHTGGIVPGGPGTEVTRVLEGGEGVFTREQMAALPSLYSGSGDTIVVNITVTGSLVTEQQLAQQVNSTLIDMGRRGQVVGPFASYVGV